METRGPWRIGVRGTEVELQNRTGPDRALLADGDRSSRTCSAPGC